ncbi:30S ribosomal protein S1 [Alloiococcus sp. CFN-8]|uniref:30S ribosomal protein S1 n=1 Tax=Alloiococcus sp. CFN-8 TaxID=3416081 RepID=UPI003CE6A84E
MVNENNNDTNMNEMIDQYEFNKIHTGDIIKGKVIKVTDSEVFVNINYFSDGIIPKEEITKDQEASLADILAVDEEIDVMVIKNSDGEGNVLLSKLKADAIKGWDELKEFFESKETVKLTVKEAVKGGAIGYYKGIRVFIPASQLSLNYVEDINTFVGKELEVEVIEFDSEKSRVVASAKAIEKKAQEEKREALWSAIKKGEKKEGTVSKLVKFGAFVDLDGIEGLVHISDLSWSRIKNPSEVVSVGDKVTVYVQNVDREKKRLSLVLKDVNQDPWKELTSKYKSGSVVQGKVTNFIAIGAFVELVPGVEGLVHISEISDEHIAKPSDVLKIGDSVKVKVLDIDEKNKKVSLSIKNASESSKEFLKYNDDSNDVTLGDLFKDKLKNFKFED